MKEEMKEFLSSVQYWKPEEAAEPISIMDRIYSQKSTLFMMRKSIVEAMSEATPEQCMAAVRLLEWYPESVVLKYMCSIHKELLASRDSAIGVKA